MRSRSACVRGPGRCRGRAWTRRCPLTHRPVEGAPLVRQQSVRRVRARCRRRASRWRIAGIGLGEHELADVVGIMRSVQPGAGADLDNPPAGVAQQRASPAAQACDFTEPEKGVVYECENPQPCRGRSGSPPVWWSSLSCRKGRTGRIPRASLEAAISPRWPVPASSEQSETSSLRDRGRPRSAAQLAADVRHVAMNSVRAQHQLRGDLAVAQPPRDARNDLPLTT